MGIDISKINTKSEAKKSPGTFSLDFLNKEFSLSRKIGAKQREALYKDLYTLLNAGVDFSTALDILANQQKKKAIKALILDVKNQIINGRSFHEALRQTGQFTAYEYFSIKIGEETKKLPLVLMELHKYFKRQIKLRKQIVSVITYPTFVLALTVGVLYFMLTYVVPMFKSVFNQFDADLPKLTRNIITLSEKFPMITIVFIGVALLLTAIFKIYGKNNTFRAYKSKILLRIPYFGKLTKMIYLARFCQFLDLLLTSKTPLTDSLGMVKKMIGFYPIENSIEPIRKDIIKGSSFSKAMAKHHIYEYKMISMVEVAEEINELDAMFSRLADEYDEEVEHRTKMIGVVLEPLIIIFIGLIVGIIMVAMYAPMFDLSKIINGG
ncbi:type II secretion system F family protein [Flavobacteriaceae bacterium TP-CH-4]|uniref:General secretion pathway protein F n=1 Tax=Pelagihabitans pacificus TaxID=2696054 RepID=A0A967E6B7_9FLAO|nr:type II secretion system F family protein [Pelagihabitans pacificus]NHF58999.1 type II secretion system F family protein [Pelagihabitans pacificus]